MRLHHTVQLFLLSYITHSLYFHDVTSQSTHFYRPGMKYAILSRILLSNSCGQPLVSGTCWVKHNKGPRAHSSESSNTDKLPDTAIWPYKLRRYITKAILQVLVALCAWDEKNLIHWLLSGPDWSRLAGQLPEAPTLRGTMMSLEYSEIWC